MGCCRIVWSASSPCPVFLFTVRLPPVPPPPIPTAEMVRWSPPKLLYVQPFQESILNRWEVVDRLRLLPGDLVSHYLLSHVTICDTSFLTVRLVMQQPKSHLCTIHTKRLYWVTAPEKHCKNKMPISYRRQKFIMCYSGLSSLCKKQIFS